MGSSLGVPSEVSSDPVSSATGSGSSPQPASTSASAPVASSVVKRIRAVMATILLAFGSYSTMIVRVSVNGPSPSPPDGSSVIATNV